MAVNGPWRCVVNTAKLASSAAMLFQQVFRSDLTAEKSKSTKQGCFEKTRRITLSDNRTWNPEGDDYDELERQCSHDKSSRWNCRHYAGQRKAHLYGKGRGRQKGDQHRPRSRAYPDALGSAIRDEGTSYHYLAPGPEVTCPPHLTLPIERELSCTGLALRTGKFSTPNPPHPAP